MDSTRFDTLLAALSAAPSRREALRLLGGLALAERFGQTAARAKHEKKKCAKVGHTTSKKRKKCCKGLGKDETGRCAARSSSCTPTTCPPASCGSMPDGCGGMLRCGGCPANQLCLRSNVCQLWSITCTGTPTECGNTLQEALQTGGTFYVCPGIYRGGFAPTDVVTLIGAGEGDDPASNTILDANGAGRVLTIPPGLPVTLERLQIARGRVTTAGATGGGILHQGTTLRMTECTVSANNLINPTTATTLGAGIFVDPSSTLDLTRCTVSNNSNNISGLDGNGGGIYS